MQRLLYQALRILNLSRVEDLTYAVIAQNRSLTDHCGLEIPTTSPSRHFRLGLLCGAGTYRRDSTAVLLGCRYFLSHQFLLLGVDLLRPLGIIGLGLVCDSSGWLALSRMIEAPFGRDFHPIGTDWD